MTPTASLSQAPQASPAYATSNTVDIIALTAGPFSSLNLKVSAIVLAESIVTLGVPGRGEFKPEHMELMVEAVETVAGGDPATCW